MKASVQYQGNTALVEVALESESEEVPLLHWCAH